MPKVDLSIILRIVFSGFNYVNNISASSHDQFGLTGLVCRLAIWLNIRLCFVENVLFRIELEAFS